MKNTFTLKLGSNSFELTEGQSPRGLRIGTQRPDKIIVKVDKEMDKLELSKHIEYFEMSNNYEIGKTYIFNYKKIELK